MNLWTVGITVGAASVGMLAVMTGQVLRSTRRMAQALVDGPRPADEILAGLDELRAIAEADGFVPAAEGLVWLGDNQLLVMVHADGTRAELIQHPTMPPGFGLGTDLDDGTPVVSMPWRHGLDRDRIRVPGASLEELLAHHRAGVAARVAEGAEVVPADPTTALAKAIESDREEMRETLEHPWRNALVVTLQQTPLRRLVGS